MTIKGIELHLTNKATLKYTITHVQGDILFHYEHCNKKYYYNCQERKIYKKVLWFWIWQRQYSIEYSVFLTD